MSSWNSASSNLFFRPDCDRLSSNQLLLRLLQLRVSGPRPLLCYQYNPLRFIRKKSSPGPLKWKRIQVLFETRPERLQVAEFLLKNGLRVRGNRTFVNDVEIPTVKVAGSRS